MISTVSSLHANVQQYEVLIMNRNENEVLKVLKMIYIQTFALRYKCFARDLHVISLHQSYFRVKKQGVFLYKEKKCHGFLWTLIENMSIPNQLCNFTYNSASCSSASTVHVFIVATAALVMDTISQTTIKSILQYDSWLWSLISLPSSTDTVELWTSHHQVTPLNIQ